MTTAAHVPAPLSAFEGQRAERERAVTGPGTAVLSIRTSGLACPVGTRLGVRHYAMLADAPPW